MNIRHQLILFMLIGALGVAAQSAHAVISCNISSPGFFAVYDSTVAVPNDTTSSVTINCTRALADPSPAKPYTLGADDGLTPSGKFNQAGNLIQYREYQDAAFSLDWDTTKTTLISVPINFGTGTTASVTIPFYIRIAAGQAAAVGNYADTVTMTLESGAPPAVVMAVATHPVLISTIPQCQISSPPGNIMFTYTAFQPTVAVASTTFAARCTTALPYTMSLDADTPMLDLTYSLLLPITTGTGTGLPQIYTINGTIPANQAGTCATAICTATAARTLLITF